MSPRPTPKGRQQLSRERILAAARAIIARDGPDALTMRQLASDLDAWPMSIYHYFPDKEALVGALIEDRLLAVSARRRRGTWQQQITTLCQDLRDALIESALSGSQVSHALLESDGLSVTVDGLAILVGAGMPPAAAAHAWRLILCQTIGSAALPAGREAARARRAVRGALAATDDEFLPLAEAARDIGDALTEHAGFVNDLDFLLAAIASSFASALDR